MAWTCGPAVGALRWGRDWYVGEVDWPRGRFVEEQPLHLHLLRLQQQQQQQQQ